jgi:ubiquinol-cytochrome c reductase cytochrome c1 subunit
MKLAGGKIMNKFVSFLIALLISTPVFASGDVELKQQTWPFDGMTGHFDRQSIQRGFQVYKEVCSSCHGLKRVSYRQLQDVGFTKDEVKVIAAGVSVVDGPNNDGDMFERPGRPSDKFVSPFANDNAAKASNNGALPPDLSLITKARTDGPNYIYSLLTGFSDAPASFKLEDGLNYNKYFPGYQIAMASPLSDGSVEYIDGTDATQDQMAKDVVNFLQWAAEPETEQRKAMGIRVMIFLLMVFVLFHLANRRTWKDIKK